MRSDRATFPGLAASHFTHPADEAALVAVRNLPLINTVLKKMIQYGFEKAVRVEAMSDSVKATPRTYGPLHGMLSDIANRLSLPVPDLFVEQNPVANAWTTGAEYPFIVVHSGLIELMTDDEVYAVLAHECGHIKCGHVLYKSAARFLTSMAASMGLVGLPLQGLTLALYEWSRKAEFTCDRASLLCVQDPAVVQHVLMKLAGGSPRLAAQIDPQEFVRQGEMYTALTAGVTLNEFYAVMRMLPMSHPFPVVRAAEIRDWSNSDGYRKLVAGDYVRHTPRESKPATQCPHCGAPTTAAETHCDRCGNMVVSVGDTLHSAGDDYLAATLKSAASTVSKAWDGVRDMFEDAPRARRADDPAWPDETSEDKGVEHPQLCARCFTLNERDARFCKKCGEALEL